MANALGFFTAIRLLYESHWFRIIPGGLVNLCMFASTMSIIWNANKKILLAAEKSGKKNETPERISRNYFIAQWLILIHN